MRQPAPAPHYPNDMSTRRLPHFYPDHRWLFLTWNLHGSLPRAVYPPAHKPSAAEAFVWIDRRLDTTESGPRHLIHPPIAKLVIDALFHGQNLGHYQLGPFVVMSNHVHVLLLPQIPPPILLKSLKGCTARQANALLHRTGDPFWQRESYDHWVRDQAQLARITAYIENNPVKAGLVPRPEDYPYSSAHPSIQARLTPQKPHRCKEPETVDK